MQHDAVYSSSSSSISRIVYKNTLYTLMHTHTHTHTHTQSKVAFNEILAAQEEGRRKGRDGGEGRYGTVVIV